MDETIAPVLGRVASGIYILTIRHQEQETGMLASWVLQAGFEPPMITVAVKQGRYVADWLDQKTPFAINIVGEEQKSLLGHFGRGFEPDQNAFEDLEIQRIGDNLPILSQSVGYLLCTPQSHIDSGDHRIFLAKVEEGKLLDDDPKPMVHVRKTGVHY